MKTRHWIVYAAPAVLALSLAACRAPGPPVARLSVGPEVLEVTYPGYTELSLSWDHESRERLEGLVGEPRVFVHLLDEGGGVTRTFDHPIPFEWSDAGSAEYEIKLYQSALAPPLAAGSYPLSIGLYDRDGNRWPLEVEGEEIDDAEYLVATVEVLEPASGFPMFYFSPEWKAIETGNDRQVLGRRWLGESGSLRVTRIDRPGTLWLQVGVPAEAAEGKVLVLAEGAAEPAVRIRSDCGAFEATASGAGSHEVEIPIEAGVAASEGEEPECAIVFEPNFYLESKGTLDRDSVALENLAWRD